MNAVILYRERFMVAKLRVTVGLGALLLCGCLSMLDLKGIDL